MQQHGVSEQVPKVLSVEHKTSAANRGAGEYNLLCREGFSKIHFCLTKRYLQVPTRDTSSVSVDESPPKTVRQLPAGGTSNNRTDIPCGVSQPKPRIRKPLRVPPRRPNVLQSTLASINCQDWSLVCSATTKHFSKSPADYMRAQTKNALLTSHIQLSLQQDSHRGMVTRKLTESRGLVV